MKMFKMLVLVFTLLAAGGLAWAAAAAPGGPAPSKRAAKPARKPTGPVIAEPAYTMPMAGYTAEVGKDGFLNNVLSAGDPKVKYADSFSFRAASLKVTGVSKTGKNEVEATFSGEKRLPRMPRDVQGEIIPDMLKVRYTFDRSEIRVAFVGKLPVEFKLAVGEDAQIVQNLNNLQEAILPVAKSFGKNFTSARFFYVHGEELLFRYDGPGHLFGANGAISRREYRRSECRADAEYTIILRMLPAKPGVTMLAAPQFSVESDVPGCIFFDGEEPRFRLLFQYEQIQATLAKLGKARLEGTRIEYSVSDHLGNELVKGAVPVDFAAEKPVSMLIETKSKQALALEAKRKALAEEKNAKGNKPAAKAAKKPARPRVLPKPKTVEMVVKNVAIPLSRRGYFEAHFRVSDARGVFRPVWTVRSFSVLQPLRTIAQERAFMGDWTGEYIRNAFIGLGLVRESINWAPHVAKGVFDFDKFHYDERFKHSQEMREKSGVNSYWMIADTTHPWAKTPQDIYEYYAAIISRYKQYNHWWETLNEPNVYGVTPQLYLEMYLKPLKLAAEKIDPQARIIAPCMCGYNLEFIDELYKLGGKDYFDALSVHPYEGMPYDVKFLEHFRKLRAIMAKYGDEKKPVWFTESGFMWGNLAAQVNDARQNVRRILIQDQNGIPKEHDFYYYTSFMGYLPFYLIEADGSLLPQAVALRGLKCRLDGTHYDRQFGFGLRFVHGSVYKAADRQVVALWSYDNRRTVELKTNATRAEGFDMWGNPLPLKISDGKLAVAISGEPTYVILPLAATVEPVMDGPPGRNVADLTMGAEASASSESSPAALALDGNWSVTGWRDADATTFPKWWQVDLAYPASVDRVHLYTGKSLRDFNLMGSVDGKWTKLAEVRGTNDYVLDLKFPPVTLTKVRVDVLAANGKQPPGIYECEVYTAAHGAAQSALVNYAAAENGAAARASSVWKMETDVPVMEKGSAISSKRQKLTVEYSPAHAIDGNFAPRTWQDYIKTVWIANCSEKLPQWLEVDFPGRKPITTVLVFVNNFGYWKAAQTGISDADLEAWDGSGWRQIGTVQGSSKGVLSYTLKEPVQTEKIRLVVKGTHDHQPAAVMEIQAWGPATK